MCCLIGKVGRRRRATSVSLLLYQHQAGREGFSVPQHLNSAEKPTAGFSETPPSHHERFWAGMVPVPHCLKILALFCLTFHAPTTTLMGALPSLFPKYDTFFCLQVHRKGSNTLPSMLLKGPKQASQTSARTYCKCFQTPAESTVKQGFFWNTVITPFGSICIGKVMLCYNTGCRRV